MSNIRIDIDYTIKDGTEIKFRSPVDCSQITGLIVYYPGSDGGITSKVFTLADAHGNNVGNINHLFAEDVVVKVILDVTKSMAFVQNADTNAYLESRINKASPVNLLDNSDFRNPVNQRGATKYTSGYCIDRWTLAMNAEVNVTDKGIQLVGGDSQCPLWQKLNAIKSGTYTFAVCDTDGNVYTVSGENESTTTIATPWGGIGFCYHISGYQYCSLVVNGGKTKTFTWVALYEGEYTADTLPKYHPKGYGVELAECMRYFYRFPNKNNANHPQFGIGIAHTATRVGLPFRLPVPMRIDTPSVAPVGSFSLSNNWTYKLGVTNIGVSERSTDMVVMLLDVADGGLVSGDTYLLQGYRDKTAHIDFSADL